MQISNSVGMISKYFQPIEPITPISQQMQGSRNNNVHTIEFTCTPFLPNLYKSMNTKKSTMCTYKSPHT